MKIRSLSISYSIEKSRQEREGMKILEDEIKKLENQMNSRPDDQTLSSLNNKKAELESNREHLIEGLILRSKANWHENGEKCTEYFCKLEKKNFINKTVSELLDGNGNHISDHTKILQEQKLFYQKLYSSRGLGCGNNIFFNHEVCLSEEQKNSCEGNLSYEECGKALLSMKNGKSPGSDGFTVDFYKFFWKNIGPFVYRSLYYGYEIGHFSQFQCQGVITCIPKEGKDRRYLNNWRPISLLNTDIKIASAAIANRLKEVLFLIISDSQKGFVKNRFIGENTRLLFDLMHYLEQNNIQGLLLLVDFEKAFDSIEWDFLKKALQSFNFGPSICKWFKTFYTDSNSCVINNGHMSSFFNLERGCRQGDPLSPYLFIIGVELLSLYIKANPDVSGVKVNGIEPLISQYADDTFLMLDGTEKSLKETLSCFEKFYEVSGLKLNTSKTKVVWVGSKKFSDQILCPGIKLDWAQSDFRVLGIDFSLDLNRMVDLNFKKKIIDVSKVLKSWHHRKLTLRGKITVIKTLALPKLIHLLTSLPNMNVSMVNDLNRLFYNFIWDNKPDKVRRNTLVRDIPHGGLKMVHIQSFMAYLKVGWLKRFFENSEGYWQNVLLSVLKDYGGDRAFRLEKEKLAEVAAKLKNPFWKDVFLSISLAKPYTKISLDEILSLDILNFVSVDDFFIFSKWEKEGIKVVRDIIDPDTKTFLSFDMFTQKTNNKNFMLYYRLISGIPRNIKNHIKNFDDYIPGNGNYEDRFTATVNGSNKLKFIYQNLVNQIVVVPYEKELKWEETLCHDIGDFGKCFILLQRCCKDIYLYTFQWKLLHRIIPTNSFLFKIHIVNSNLCTFCKENVETLEHLFFECQKIEHLLVEFSNCVKRFYTEIEFNKKDFLIGCHNYSLLLNFLLIITKNIFQCKNKEILPNIIGLKSKIKKCYYIEHYIAKKNNRLYAFEKFWTPVKVIFPEICHIL